MVIRGVLIPYYKRVWSYYPDKRRMQLDNKPTCQCLLMVQRQLSQSIKFCLQTIQYMIGSGDNFDFWKMHTKPPIPYSGVKYITCGWFRFHFQKFLKNPWLSPHPNMNCFLVWSLVKSRQTGRQKAIHLSSPCEGGLKN